MRAVALLLAVVGGVAWLARDATWFPPLPHAAPQTAHAAYVKSLEQSGLADTALGRQWLEVAARVVDAPVTMRLPFERSALHTPQRPTAFAYRLTLKRGQRVDVTATSVGDTPVQTFIDVFQSAGNERPEPRVGSLRGTSFESARDGDVIVRIQPELLRGGTIRVVARAAPSLRFPVANARVRDLKSIFGDQREAGRRQHEGVDIFAKRGTPVLAASNGMVTRVNETAIGGRVVWVWDNSRSLMIYYAHLDEQFVSTGQYVRSGDVIGTVGNTGNARTTPPHLHFGIYESGRGAIDPEAFIVG